MCRAPAFPFRAVFSAVVLAGLVSLLAGGCGEPPATSGTGPTSRDAIHPEPLCLAEAENHHATSRVNFGDPSARSHLADGVSADAVGEVDRGPDGPVEGTYVYGVGEATEIAFWVIEPRRLAFTLRGAPPPELDGDQRVTVELDGRRITSFGMSPGFRAYEGHLPADALRPGRNVLRLRYAATAGPRVLDVTDGEDREVGALWDLLLLHQRIPPPHAGGVSGDGGGDGGGDEDLAEPRTEDDGRLVILPPGVEATWHLLARPGSRLYFERVVAPLRGSELRVRLRRDRTDAETDPGAPDAGKRHDEPYVLEQIHHLAPGDDLAVDLPVGVSGDRPGRAVPVEVSLAAVPTRRPGGEVRLHRPAFQAASSGTSASAGRLGTEAIADPRPAEPPPLVVFLIDTLRADHLGAYGHDRDTSPRLDAFARDDAVVFEQVGAQSSWTRTAVASIFTGLDPGRHGVHQRTDVLTDRALTLPEMLRDGGYRTGGWTTNGNAGPAFGFGQGFGEFRLIHAARPGDPAPASRPLEAADRFLEQAGEEPFFLYLHLMEPHAPYWPEPGPAEALGVPVPRVPDDASAVAEVAALAAEQDTPSPTPTRLGAVPWLQALNQGRVEATPGLVDSLRSLYEAEIRTVDGYFGELVDLLREHGIYDDAWIVVVADHGEEFHDHGAFSHGRTLYEEQLRVPLLVKPPAGLGVPGGLRVETLVRQTDLFPTLLEAAGLDVPDGLDGRSLWPLLAGVEKGVEDPDRASFAQLRLDGRRLRSLRLGDVKLICPDPPPADGPGTGNAARAACSLYDLAEDPGETTDLAARRPVLVAHLARRMETFLHPGSSLAEERLLDEETEEQLRALGYH